MFTFSEEMKTLFLNVISHAIALSVAAQNIEKRKCLAKNI